MISQLSDHAPIGSAEYADELHHVAVTPDQADRERGAEQLLWRRTERLPVALFGGLGAWWLAGAVPAVL